MGSEVDVDTGIVAKGFKTREPKHKGNKRLKSGLEAKEFTCRSWWLAVLRHNQCLVVCNYLMNWRHLTRKRTTMRIMTGRMNC
ncbi:hypothetical protein CJ030_MR5G025040 [Morella rubra]|uniref:Uncharacterized protein n=1 Tax=Morella rubra TaxID=262757 RepID=A0A6A1VHC7_9ROSI|nr:hypothetical protein CJ030_MR5G025040 [Morella rubra]